MKTRNYHIKYIVKNRLYKTQVIDNKKKNVVLDNPNDYIEEYPYIAYGDDYIFTYDKIKDITRFDIKNNNVLLRSEFLKGKVESIYQQYWRHNPYGPAYIEYGMGNKITYQEYWLNGSRLKHVYSDDDLYKHVNLLNIK